MIMLSFMLKRLRKISQIFDLNHLTPLMSFGKGEDIEFLYSQMSKTGEIGGTAQNDNGVLAY
jgi:hypothetical protein